MIAKNLTIKLERYESKFSNRPHTSKIYRVKQIEKNNGSTIISEYRC